MFCLKMQISSQGQMLQAAKTHRQLKSVWVLQVCPSIATVYHARRMRESRGSVKYISFHICVQKILYSSASGEMAAQVQTFRKVFAGFVLIQWVLSGSGICENYVEDDS